MIKLRILVLFLFFHGFAAAKPELLFSNSYYRFYADSLTQRFFITSVNVDTLIGSMSYYSLLIDAVTRDTIKTGPATTFTFSGTDGMLRIDGSNKYSNVQIKLAGNETSEIKIEVETRYLAPVEVIREALIFDLSQPVTEVYRKNGTIDSSYFQSEYWLGKEGMKSGIGEKSLLVYHTPSVSSMQFDSRNNRLIVNLDFNEDHPHQYFPLLDSAMNVKQDRSCSLYSRGEKRTNGFSFYAGMQVHVVPRLMASPDGFPSAYIFTEHADWTDLRSHRAVYFGSEDIVEADSATGGFVKHKIPVTKSVFYSNPDQVLNSDSRHNNYFRTPVASIQDTPGFLEFLNQLQSEGHEICLHTPDHFTAKTKLIQESCTFMKKQFKSVTWIDHGYNNGPKNNREAFVCDGLTSGSSFYAKDTWEKNGVRYFWNSWYEDFNTSDSLFSGFNGSLMRPYPGFGDASPTPLYWRHPTRTADFYSWPTRDILDMPDPASWMFHFSPSRLQDFATSRSVKFQHCYPAGAVVGSGFWTIRDQRMVVHPEFDRVLRQLAEFRNRGLINLTTVRSMMGYWIDCENISMDFSVPGVVKITNRNNHEVKGVSFAAAAKKVTIPGKRQIQKFFDGDLIFWFDLKAGETASMTFE